MKTRTFLQLIMAALLLIVTSTCKKEKEPDAPLIDAEIIISPAEIQMNDNETAKLYLAVKPPVKTDWTISTKPAWLNITPSSGTINAQTIELELSVDAANLSPGFEYGIIEIISSVAGKASSHISVAVEPQPVAELSIDELDFAADEVQKKFNISNTGSGFLHWQLESDVEWITFDPFQGTLFPGEMLEVTANVNRSGLPAGVESGQMLLVSNATHDDINVNMNMEVSAMAILESSSQHIHFGHFVDETEFYLSNIGNISSSWEFLQTEDYISAEPSSGELAPNDSILIVLNIDRNQMQNQTYETNITFSSNSSDHLTVSLSIDHFVEDKWLIDGMVVDAVYCRVNDVIVLITGNPSEIRKLDPVNNTSESLQLVLPGKRVSVSQDGNYAVVGHNANISYINLNTMQLEHVYPTTIDVHDLLIAPNNWVYAVPASGQWERLRCIDLSTGLETTHIGNSIRDRTRIKLHPSGDYIYGADNGLSPSDFEKYDIRGGTAVYMYDSPYHGTYGFGGDIWISDGGARLFSRLRNVFHATEDPNTDITYSGQLAGEGSVVTLDSHADINKIYGIFSAGDIWTPIPDKYIRIYEGDYLAYQGNIELPGFFIPDGSGDGQFFDSEGHFGFFNADGSKFYVLVKVTAGSGALNEWAVATIEVN